MGHSCRSRGKHCWMRAEADQSDSRLKVISSILRPNTTRHSSTIIVLMPLLSPALWTRKNRMCVKSHSTVTRAITWSSSPTRQKLCRNYPGAARWSLPRCQSIIVVHKNCRSSDFGDVSFPSVTRVESLAHSLTRSALFLSV